MIWRHFRRRWLRPRLLAGNARKVVTVEPRLIHAANRAAIAVGCLLALPVYPIGACITLVVASGDIKTRAARAAIWPIFFMPLRVDADHTIGGFRNTWLLAANRWLDGQVRNDEWRCATRFHDLAPSIHRQRLVIEGYPRKPITDTDIKRFLSRLSTELDMKDLIEPVTHRSDTYGWAGWIHWETSGAHFYAWEQPLLFFSVDIYTCKPFNPVAAIHFTSNFFEASDVTAKDF